jgi:choline dehydrogenase-like flavoprotein
VKSNLLSRMPLMSQNIFLGDLLQVQSTRWTEPIPGLNGRQNRMWAAEAVGGASRINALLWTRGTPGDYEAWASDFGLDEWCWEKVEPYFRRMENAMSDPESEDRGHGGKHLVAGSARRGMPKTRTRAFEGTRG